LATKHGIESICNSHSFRVNWETSQMWRWVCGGILEHEKWDSIVSQAPSLLRWNLRT
jgi:hypothetical protein